MILATLLLVSGVSFLAQSNGEANARRECSESISARSSPGAGVPADDTTRYPHAFVDLDGHGPEVIVYIEGRDWCGSGGCNTLVLAPQGPSYRVVSSITITRPPIRVLAARSHGWHNIAVWVAGGGIRPGYEAELPFNGKTYALNPSVAPARRLAPKAPGQVVLPANAEGPLLYQ